MRFQMNDHIGLVTSVSAYSNVYSKITKPKATTHGYPDIQYHMEKRKKRGKNGGM